MTDKKVEGYGYRKWGPIPPAHWFVFGSFWEWAVVRVYEDGTQDWVYKVASKKLAKLRAQNIAFKNGRNFLGKVPISGEFRS